MLIVFITLIVITFVVGSPIEKVHSASFRIASGEVEFQDIDTSSGMVLLHFVFDEQTGSDDYRDRSMSWIIWEYGKSGGFVSTPIGPADPDWKLIGTNNDTSWKWRLEKTLWANYHHSGFFPLEQFKVSFYVCSNESRGFEVRSLIPNSFPSIFQTGVVPEEVPHSFKFEGVPEQIRVDISFGPDSISSLIGVMLYVLFGVLIVLWGVLFQRRRSTKLEHSIMITSSVLVFLPILVFTFRTSIAPKYLMPIDILGFSVMLVFGILLIYEFYAKTRTPRMNFDPGLYD